MGVERCPWPPLCLIDLGHEPRSKSIERSDVVRTRRCRTTDGLRAVRSALQQALLVAGDLRGHRDTSEHSALMCVQVAPVPVRVSRETAMNREVL